MAKQSVLKPRGDGVVLLRTQCEITTPLHFPAIVVGRVPWQGEEMRNQGQSEAYCNHGRRNGDAGRHALETRGAPSRQCEAWPSRSGEWGSELEVGKRR